MQEVFCPPGRLRKDKEKWVAGITLRRRQRIPGAAASCGWLDKAGALTEVPTTPQKKDSGSDSRTESGSDYSEDGLVVY